MEVRGALASIGASVLFGALFLLPPMLGPLSGTEVFGWRVLMSVPVVLVVFTLTRRLGNVVAVLRRVVSRPWLVAVVVADGLLLGVQLWLFSWAPKAGHGLETALGYLLLPLVMVLIGVVLHGEQVSVLRGAAVAAAGVGVAAAFLLDGGLSWVTAAVALGYPLYFQVRRRARLDTSGAMLLEMAVLVQVAVVIVAAGDSVDALADAPGLMPVIAALGLVSGVAMVMYLAASRWLSFGVFGMLSYLEPVLLVVVSVALLGEGFAVVDWFVYGPILAALVLLGVESVRTGRRVARREGPELETTAEPGTTSQVAGVGSVA